MERARERSVLAGDGDVEHEHDREEAEVAAPDRDGDQAEPRWPPGPRLLCSLLGMLHQPTTSTYVSDVLIIIEYESGGDQRARNDVDVNAQNGDPSRGLMQTIGATFSAYRSSALPNNIFDPAASIYAGLAYGIARYGSIPSIPGVKSVNAGHAYVPYAPIRRPPAV